MQLSFRWFGEDDTVTLECISQIPGMRVIAAAVQDVPVGEVWGISSILKLRKQIEDAGLVFEVVEDIPVHEDIKLGKTGRDHYIENYCENIRRAAAVGIKCICYNFIPGFEVSGNDERKKMIAEYRRLSSEDLWKNLQYFLDRIIPVAAECNVNMAMHGDDKNPMHTDFPHFLTREEHMDRLLRLVNDPHNGLTFCTGSLYSFAENDVAKLAAKYAQMGRIHFVHLRNVAVMEYGVAGRVHFSSCKTLDMYAILKALHDQGFNGYIGPDRGQMIWGKNGLPGGGFYDLALGTAYINGLWEAIVKSK